MTELFSAKHDEAGNAVLSGGQTIVNFHSSDSCAGEFCPVHNPSNHEHQSLPLFFNGINMIRELPDRSYIPDPDDYLFNKTGQAILKNSAKCLKCDDVIASESRHDFKKCSCGNVFVDGGLNYLRHGCVDFDLYEDTSKVFKKD